MKTFCGIFCVSFCLFLGVPQSRAGYICSANPHNLVNNCGFETGNFTGWTLSGNDVPGELGNLYGVEGLDPLDGISPDNGSYQAYFADLDANATTLSQTIATVAGDRYQVSWYLVQDTAVVAPYSNQFSASFGGVSLVNLTAVPVEGYTYYSYSTVAASSSSVLSLRLGNDLGEFLVDDVSVILTPEPSAWTLLLAGAISIGVFRLTHRRFYAARANRSPAPGTSYRDGCAPAPAPWRYRSSAGCGA